jgi:hypothetical protein
MSDIYEINLKTGISLKKLRSMKKQGFLSVTIPKNPETSKMLWTLRKGNRLTVLDLVALIENRDSVGELGSYASLAQKQLEALGDAQGEAADLSIVNVIDQASQNKDEWLDVLEQWMKKVIPPNRDVPHHYIAVRAVLGMPQYHRGSAGWQVPKAILNVRDRHSFAGWYTVKATSYAHKATFYHRPKLAFDL